MHRMIWLGLGVGAMAVLTWAVGWWTVPIVGGAWAFVKRDDAAAPLLAGLAAMLAWGILLLLGAVSGPVGTVMRVVGEAMRIGPAGLLALTLVYAALLGASAAALVRAVVGGRKR